MTTVIAVQKSDHVILASDSQATKGSQRVRMEDGKIRTNGEYTFSVAGLYSMIGALENADFPPVDDSVPLRKFVSMQVAPLIRRIEKRELKNTGAPPEFQHMMQSTVVLVVRGQVFEIDNGVIGPKVQSGVYVTGSGSYYALGALSGVVSPSERDVYRALTVASSNDVGTSAPFMVKKVY